MDKKSTLPPDFPAEITFKAVFRERDRLREEIESILAEKGIDARLGEKRSAKNNFISFTVTATFPSEEMLQLVGLDSGVMNNYPHELSGGQKQRVAIARAMILRPSLVILDEPVSALDVSIRAQVLNLLADIQEKLGLTYFIISHDLATVGHVSKRIGIMYLGRIVEMGDTDEVFSNPLHPYTRALFAAMPQPDPGRIKEKASLSGEIGSALNLPRGCRFHPRCEYAVPECQKNEPSLREVSAIHAVACQRINL